MNIFTMFQASHKQKHSFLLGCAEQEEIQFPAEAGSGHRDRAPSSVLI